MGYRIVKQSRAVPASAALKLALAALVVLLLATPAHGTLVNLLGTASFESANFLSDAAPCGGVALTGGLDNVRVTAVPELSTWFMGAGALAILLCFAWSVHSPGSGVIRIGKRE